MLHLYTNLGSKINQIQEMVPYYGKVCYDYNSIYNIFSLTNFSINTESHIIHIEMMISLFKPIEGSSSSGEINKGCMSSSPHILQQAQIFSPQWNIMWWDSQADK